MSAFRAAALCLCLALIAGCQKNDLKDPPVPLGPFKLGLNIVVADKVQKVPISREASPEEWQEAVKTAVSDRFGRYDGDKFYNIGISVDGYALAPPGIPIVAAPKSVLMITANIWDDSTQTKLNPKGERIIVMESLSGETVIGTGLTRTKKQQMAALSYNAAKKVEEWLLRHPEWFGLPSKPGAAPAGPVAAPQFDMTIPPLPPADPALRPVPRPAGMPAPAPERALAPAVAG